MNKRAIWATGTFLAALGLVAACTGADAGTGGSDGNSSSEYTYTSDQDDIESIEGIDLGASAMPEGSGETVGVVLKALTNQYWQGIEQGVQAAAEDFGVEVTLQAASSESAQSEQLTIAQTMVNQIGRAHV